MIKLGPYIIIKAAELPKKLTAYDLELLLTGKRHLQKYPGKRKVRSGSVPGEERIFHIKGE